LTLSVAPVTLRAVSRTAKGEDVFNKVHLCIALAATSVDCTPSLLAKVQSETSCENLHQEHLGEYLEKVTGCGTEDVYGYDKASHSWRSLSERAAFDLRCTRDNLQVHHLGGREVGVIGCGRTATYIADCIGVSPAHCAFSGWVMNNSTGNDGTPHRGVVP
jgi:hypothetical protein